MKKIILGSTGIEVTELCFGALPMGPAQKNMPAGKSAEVVAEALRLGVTFIDTAQGYKTYDPIRIAMEQTGIRPVIATKAAAVTYEEMEAAVHEAIEKLNIDFIDIFLLHAARVDADVFEIRKGALDCLLDYKKKGVIKAVGISTHAMPVVKKAAENPDIDIVFPILNKIGMGVISGTREDMENAINDCLAQNKGVYLMKVLAGGNLIDDYIGALDYGRSFADGKMAIAVGMVSPDEARMNVDYFNGVDIREQAKKLNKANKDFLVLAGMCKQCGKCVEACHNSAITLKDGSPPTIDVSRCLYCGYCVNACPQFAIRMI
jgi:aryl-alcohol dehydrogenase-like predicted oxidoreductase/NAD-dependent dihydropyrimidine dehydrogenase PreA subunit